LIGVLVKENQRRVVEEFFELFKTPWEFYKAGRRYDVVLSNVDEPEEVQAKLLVIYDNYGHRADHQNGVGADSRNESVYFDHNGIKVPVYGEWRLFENTGKGTPLLTGPKGNFAVKVTEQPGETVIRVGYDLFREVELLLIQNQPSEFAHLPTLDLHICVLRNWILNAGLSLVEISPTPLGFNFTVCLTHDIDFVGIKNHKFDHTMLGFLYRSTVSAVGRCLKGRISIGRLFESWRAAFSLPFVYLGLARDFWEPFAWYANVENGLAATYFLIPFKGRAGEQVPGSHPSRRAAAYEASDIAQAAAVLQRNGNEVGVHGIDAWHSVERGRSEAAKIAKTIDQPPVGIRMHWLLQDSKTPFVLEESGYAYDSTAGYNEFPGYRNGTSQVFRPLGTNSLLELPLHIQDGALFYPQNLNLTEPEAQKYCQRFLGNARETGGVLTILWHDRSHAAERFWGDFYAHLVETLKSSNVWFATCAQVTGWFRNRREIRFEIRSSEKGTVTAVCYRGDKPVHPFQVKIYGRNHSSDLEQEIVSTRAFVNGEMEIEFGSDTSERSAASSHNRPASGVRTC